jgi:hypothetical protein
MGDIDIVQNHLKWGRHDAAAAMLQAMSPETEAVAKSLAKYWIQRAHIEEHGGNHAQVQAIFKMAGEHVQGTAQAAEIETEASRYQKRTARWQKVASAQKDSEQQQLDGDDYEDTVLLDRSMSGEPGSVVDDTSKRLSFTSMQLSPPSASSSSSSSTFANTTLMAEDDNNDDDNDISFVFSGGNDSLDLNEDVQSENEDVNTFSSSSSSSFSASKASFSATSSRRRSLTASGRKKIVRVAKCGGLVLVDAPRPQDREGIDEDSEDENMLLQSPPRPSSVVRMAAVRVASGSKQRELGSARALTPVRRAVRLAKNDEPVLSTTEMLMQNGYSYMPNPSLCGTHFAPNMPLMASDNEPSESDSDGETNENANDPSPRSDEISSCSGGRNSSSSDAIKSQMISPADLASSGESSREPTPMLPRKFAGSSMPPPPPRAPASSTQLGSAFVFNGVTPVRRSARIQELTPTPLRKEMESMLGF